MELPIFDLVRLRGNHLWAGRRDQPNIRIEKPYFPTDTAAQQGFAGLVDGRTHLCLFGDAISINLCS
jgi:hypothetical protein